MTEQELAKLKELWEKSTIEPSMYPVYEWAGEGYRIFDAEMAQVASAYGGHLSTGEKEKTEAAANADLIVWLLNHSFEWVNP